MKHLFYNLKSDSCTLWKTEYMEKHKGKKNQIASLSSSPQRNFINMYTQFPIISNDSFLRIIF